MPNLKKITFLVFSLVSIFLQTAHAQVPNEIMVSFETGNSKLLSAYFNQNVELMVLDNENVYSKAQAEQIVSNFFSNFTPVEEDAFQIIHNSGKEGARSVIGKLKTTKGSFRVYFLLKKSGSKEYIHQLRIDKQ
ncbi:MAG TPA: DUF4783 domain-containing protein [Draconibacterium sp.]|nr:DUF4783 domain-containing protein [Draconibacterium sp.]